MFLLPLIIVTLSSLSSIEARAAELEPGIAIEAPWLTADQVHEHAIAAAAAETDEMPASLMVGVAIRESALDSSARPDCGVMQVLKRHLGREGCALARSGPAEGYAAGAWAYSEVLADCRVWKRAGRLAKGVTLVECALNYYAEGGAAGRRGYGVKGCKGRTKCDRAWGPLGRARRIERAGQAVRSDA